MLNLMLVIFFFIPYTSEVMITLKEKQKKSFIQVSMWVMLSDFMAFFNRIFL